MLWFGSIALVLHLSAFGVHALSARSGPWPFGDGNSMGEPPYFIQQPDDWASRLYLQPLRMTHNYHFSTNQVSGPGVSFEVRLKDAAGQVIKTVEFPEKTAWPWTRYRQKMLAQWLGNDIPVGVRQGERIAAKEQKLPAYKIWSRDDDKQPFRLKTVPEHLIRDAVTRGGPAFAPSDWSMLVAKSYMRYLCREHEADSAELVRNSQEAIRPESLIAGQVVGNFDRMVSIFEVYHAE